MNAFQPCRNTSDAVPLYLSQQLYLKPIARLKISLQLPQRTMGKSISNWEVMERLRFMIKPEEFSILKVTKTNLEFIRFEAEIEDKSKIENVIAKLDNKMIKLKEFPELMKLRACEAKLNFPTRHSWDTFFREAKEMNEMKPGERPDTIHLSNLPIKWFIPYHLSNEEDVKPSEKIFFRVFEKFGQLRRVDIPICDPYRSKMKAEVSGMQVFDFKEEHFFEGYVQFKDYMGFTKAMDAFRGMKLLYKGDGESFTVNINVDFDRTKHLSDASARRREIVRDRLVRKEIDREEKERVEKQEEELRIQAERQKEIDEKTAKERRRRDREEKRKSKILAKLKVKGADEINEKIAKEEKKLLKVQRKLEAIRLVEELFRRIKIKKEKDLKAHSSKNNNEDELTRLKNSSELEVRQQKEKLHRVIEGRVVLKSILTGGPRIRSFYDSSSSDSSAKEEPRKKKGNINAVDNTPFDPNFQSAESMLTVGDWYGYPPSNGLYPYPAMYPALRGHPSNYFPYIPRGRGGGRGAIAGPSRGLSNTYVRRPRGGRYRGGYRGGKAALYPPELQEQYYRYFEKFLHEHDDRPHHSYSRSRSRSHSRYKSSSRRSRSRSRKRSRSRTRSYSRHRSRDYKSRSRSRSRSKTRRSFSRSRSHGRSKRKSRSHSRRSRSGSSRHSSKSRRTPPFKNKKHVSRSRSRSHRKSKEKIKSKSRSPSYRSIDSSKFISPSRLRIPRSKSWSLPRETSTRNTKRSWSKSPSPQKKIE